MICLTPFLLTIGQRDETVNSVFSSVLADAWRCKLFKSSYEENPNECISALANERGLTQFLGDFAMLHPDGGTWLEALAAWKAPVILFVLPASDGMVGGEASAYVALCKQLSVNLIGLVQVGGPWDSHKRKLDGLPWCGFFPSDLLNQSPSIQSLIILDELIRKLEIQLKYLP